MLSHSTHWKTNEQVLKNLSPGSESIQSLDQPAKTALDFKIGTGIYGKLEEAVLSNQTDKKKKVAKWLGNALELLCLHKTQLIPAL